MGPGKSLLYTVFFTECLPSITRIAFTKKAFPRSVTLKVKVYPRTGHEGPGEYSFLNFGSI
jgi:hypothetical protein